MDMLYDQTKRDQTKTQINEKTDKNDITSDKTHFLFLKKLTIANSTCKTGDLPQKLSIDRISSKLGS